MVDHVAGSHEHDAGAGTVDRIFQPGKRRVLSWGRGILYTVCKTVLVVLGIATLAVCEIAYRVPDHEAFVVDAFGIVRIVDQPSVHYTPGVRFVRDSQVPLVGAVPVAHGLGQYGDCAVGNRIENPRDCLDAVVAGFLGGPQEEPGAVVEVFFLHDGVGIVLYESEPLAESHAYDVVQGTSSFREVRGQEMNHPGGCTGLPRSFPQFGKIRTAGFACVVDFVQVVPEFRKRRTHAFKQAVACLRDCPAHPWRSCRNLEKKWHYVRFPCHIREFILRRVRKLLYLVC